MHGTTNSPAGIQAALTVNAQKRAGLVVSTAQLMLLYSIDLAVKFSRDSRTRSQ
jgi:hypothetical protein